MPDSAHATVKLSLSISGGGQAEIVATPPGTPCGGDTFCYEADTEVLLQVVPQSGNRFLGWSNACAEWDDYPCRLTLVEDVTAKAFVIPETGIVTVALVGSGSGVVTEKFGGIFCDPTDRTCWGTFPVGTPVELTATPTSGHIFAGWQGHPCGTSATCTVIANGEVPLVAIFAAECSTMEGCVAKPKSPPTHFERPLDTVFLDAAKVGAGATVIHAAPLTLPESQQTAWCGTVQAASGEGATRLCLDAGHQLIDLGAAYLQEHDLDYARRGAVSKTLARLIRKYSHSEIHEVSIWLHAKRTDNLPAEPACAKYELCPYEAERVADLDWRVSQLYTRLQNLGADILYSSNTLPYVRARLSGGMVADLRFDPAINRMDSTTEAIPAQSNPMSIPYALCGSGLEAMRAQYPSLNGEGIPVGIYEKGLPISSTSLNVHQTFADLPSTDPFAQKHARRIAYLMKNHSGIDPPVAGGVKQFLAAGQQPASPVGWLSVQGVGIINHSIVYERISEATASLGERGLETVLMDYLPTIAFRPLVIGPAADGNNAFDCTPPKLPLQNGLVTSTFTYYAACDSATATFPPGAVGGNAAEGNPTSYFGPEYALPHLFSPGGRQQEPLNFDGETSFGASYGAVFVTGAAAAAVQHTGYRMVPTLMRAILTAGQRLDPNHGLDCDEFTNHFNGKDLFGQETIRVAGYRGPRGIGNLQTAGHDTLRVTASDFGPCRVAGGSPGSVRLRRPQCALLGGRWPIQVPSGGAKNLRVVLHWNNFPTCEYQVRARLLVSGDGPRVERHPVFGPCADPAQPTDFALRLWRNGQVAAFADARDGTWEVIDIDAKQGGDYEIEVILWDRQLDRANYLGLAWSLVNK